MITSVKITTTALKKEIFMQIFTELRFKSSQENISGLYRKVCH